MKASLIDDPLLASLPHPDDDAVLAAARWPISSRGGCDSDSEMYGPVWRLSATYL